MTILNFWNGIGGDMGQSLAIAAALVLTLLALYPVMVFLRLGWCGKRDDIVNTFSIGAMQCYLNTFQKNTVQKIAKRKAIAAIQAVEDSAVQVVADKVKQSGNDAPSKTELNAAADAEAASTKAKFTAIYNDNFGRDLYAIPLLLFLAICLAATFFSCEWALTRINVVAAGALAVLTQHGAIYVALPQLAAIAEIGAYAFIVSDLFVRSQRQSMQPVDVLNAALRLAIAGPIGYAFAAIGGGGDHLLGPALAFCAGAFPLDQVRIILRRFATKQGLSTGIEEGQDQVIELNSVDPPTADLLLDSGISTVAQLAYCDPVRLCMRTGLKFDYVVDIVSQALAWLYFEDKLDTLRPAGLRGVIELKNLVASAKGDPEQTETLKALALCDIAAQMVGLSPAAFLNACDEATEDSATEFLIAVWQET